jgi:uncharacterized protein (UPF0335 family)
MASTMKLSKLKSIISEELNKIGHPITEGLLEKILVMVLSPKVRRDAEKIKNSPEWKNLQARLKQSVETLKSLEKEAEGLVKSSEELYKQAKTYGYEFSGKTSHDQKVSELQRWRKDLESKLKVAKSTKKNFDK